MVHTRRVLARRERLPTPTGELTDGAATALQVGRVDQALRIYRDLERLEGENPTWSLRVAECYRRLAQRDGEVSALMRAASRYERRGFAREALALWKRVQMVDPDHDSATVAVERLEPSCGLGLERFRSSFPPSFSHPASHVAPARHGTESELAEMPTIPAPPLAPVIEDAEELDIVVVDAGLEGAAIESEEAEAVSSVPAVAAVPLSAVELASTEREVLFGQLEAVDIELDAPATQLSGDVPEVAPDSDSPVFALATRRPVLDEVVPVTLRAHGLDEALAVAPKPAPKDVVAVREPTRTDSHLRLRAVVVTPVVPVVAELPPLPPMSAPILPLPIIAVGREEAEAEVEILDAEVLPCIREIDGDW